MAQASTTLIRVGTQFEVEKAERLKEIATHEDCSFARIIRRALEREIRLHDERVAA